MNYLRTGILLAALTALFMGIGYLLGGESGMIIALAIAAGMNVFAWWNSDKLVLRMYRAQPVGLTVRTGQHRQTSYEGFPLR